MSTYLHRGEARLNEDDVLLAVLAVAASEKRMIAAGMLRLQEIFAELASTRHYEMVNHFPFSYDGPKPFSRRLEESMRMLQLSGVIAWFKPECDSFRLNPSASHFLNDMFLPHITERQKVEIFVAGQALAQVLAKTAG